VIPIVVAPPSIHRLLHFGGQRLNRLYVVFHRRHWFRHWYPTPHARAQADRATKKKKKNGGAAAELTHESKPRWKNFGGVSAHHHYPWKSRHAIGGRKERKEEWLTLCFRSSVLIVPARHAVGGKTLGTEDRNITVARPNLVMLSAVRSDCCQH
jgi:hypothetical protein